METESEQKSIPDLQIDDSIWYLLCDKFPDSSGAERDSL